MIFLALTLAFQVDQARVDEAVRKGVEYLRKADSPAWSYGVKDADELVLLTLLHAGQGESDPKVRQLLDKILEGPLETTYEVSVQAMALEELDRVRYQGRILQCAQFLVDNQCRNGQWSYGKPSPAVKDLSVPTVAGAPEPARQVRVFGRGRLKPKVVRRIPVRKTRDGPDGGDNSNSQYAALGLRACHDAGIVIPKDVVAVARKGWMESQIVPPKDGEAVATGLPGTPRGWCYRGHHHALKYCKSPDEAYASMTAGAVGALAICDNILGVDWKRNKALQNGLAWLAHHWSWGENAGEPEIGGATRKGWLLYSYYGIERVGMLLDLPKIGSRDWYREGAAVLLDGQRPDGSWLMSEGKANRPTWDTCFAILFLKRATRPLDVASVDRFQAGGDR